MARRRNNNSKTSSSRGEKSKEPLTKEPQSGSAGTEPEKTNENSPEKNDPAWYANDPQLLADAARINFSTPFGAPLTLFESRPELPVGDEGQVTDDFMGDKFAPMGVCSLRVKPSIGRSLTRNDPANVAAQALYSYIRYANSGRKNYDPADSFLYAMTIADLYSFITWCQRLYAMSYMYSQRNWYIAEDLIKANGVAPDQLRMNLAKFRYWINSFINRVASWCVPSSIYYFQRRAFMYSNLYIENAMGNIKDQIYQFVPDGWFKFDHGDDQFGGKLVYTKWMGSATSLKTLDELMEFGEALIAPIFGDEDFAIISGDILKAFGSNIIGLSQQGDDAAIIPVYDPYVLSQMKNASIIELTTKTLEVPGVSYTHEFQSGDIIQDAGNIICIETAADTRQAWLNGQMNKVLSIEVPEADIGMIVESTRCTSTFITGETIGAHTDVPDGELICGSDIVVDATVTWKFILRTTGAMDTDFYTVKSNLVEVSQVNPWDTWNMLTRLTQFKYFPTLFKFETSRTNQIVQAGLVGNIDNFAIIDEEQLRRLHECSLLSLFYVPGVAKIV